MKHHYFFLAVFLFNNYFPYINTVILVSLVLVFVWCVGFYSFTFDFKVLLYIISICFKEHAVVLFHKKSDNSLYFIIAFILI